MRSLVLRRTGQRLGISPIAGQRRLCNDSHNVRTVLIVDDHAGFRGFARRLLEAGGFTVVGEARDGASALEAVEELRPELVLLDVVLPDTDGFAVAERLAEQADGPIVVLTSSREAADFGGRLAGSPASAASAVPESSSLWMKPLAGSSP